MSNLELFVYFAGCYAVGVVAFAALYWLMASALGDAIADCFYY